VVVVTEVSGGELPEEVMVPPALGPLVGESCALPSLLVTVPPVSAEINVGGARASESDAEPTGGLALGSFVVVVAGSVDAVPVLVSVLASLLEPEVGELAVPESTLSVPLPVALVVPVPELPESAVGATTVSGVDTESTVVELVSVEVDDESVVTVLASTVASVVVTVSTGAGGSELAAGSLSKERTRAGCGEATVAVVADVLG